mmetsp:Transcript_83928/g.224545  ORF Transcript_83928/g.224545 Transcript_83928/m.224545 type:complete len:327 (-) Transcript_83928:584-1564(-)
MKHKDVAGFSEIYGEAGVGKSQILLQLLIRVQYPLSRGGLARKAVYICTEGEAPIKRLKQLADFQFQDRSSIFNGVHPFENIFIETGHSAQDMLDIVQKRLPILMDAHPIGVVVLDSIAAPIRGDDFLSSIQQSASRAELLIHLGSLLKTLASRHNAVVVIANQVSDVIRPDSSTNLKEPARSFENQLGMLSEASLDKKASMGLAWSHCVNTRILMTRKRQLEFSADSPPPTTKVIVVPSPQATSLNSSTKISLTGKDAMGKSAASTRVQGNDVASSPRCDAQQEPDIRQLHVIWSPWTAPSVCEVDITERGVAPSCRPTKSIAIT